MPCSVTVTTHSPTVLTKHWSPPSLRRPGRRIKLCFFFFSISFLTPSMQEAHPMSPEDCPAFGTYTPRSPRAAPVTSPRLRASDKSRQARRDPGPVTAHCATSPPWLHPDTARTTTTTNPPPRRSNTARKTPRPPTCYHAASTRHTRPHNRQLRHTTPTRRAKHCHRQQQL
ncbi:hypothetical protein EDB92DRAFT_2111520 [Lactarius akahatsu]|uniref:Uncharacterized protein n=1 Tax=Lactarius akahatsu TaxID=416441 RepID=A0AAD4QEW3_9AGAM|nr:hypothetical protein EDB92DRAFT_2111520 [Lactarius akahatsu]